MKNSFKNYLKKFFCLWLILGQLVLMTGCSIFKSPEKDKNQVWERQIWNCFDTFSRIYTYAGESSEEFTKNTDKTASLLSEYHELFDIYNEYPGKNNLCTLNKNAGGEPIVLDDKLIEFLNYTKEIYNLTNGENNVMLGSVLKLWHECRELADIDPTHATIPNMDDLKEASKHTSIELLEIDNEKKTARISDPLASIDVGAIGKGYATEKIAQDLEQRGLTSYVLNIGGNIRIVGTKPDGTGWNTGIKDPFNKDGGYCNYINISDTSCVTSGIYERNYVVDGKTYHHIIDKDTLMPAEGYASITVITKDSGLADSLSTALFTMPFEDGFKLVNSLDGVEAFWVFMDNTMERTEGFKKIEIEPKK